MRVLRRRRKRKRRRDERRKRRRQRSTKSQRNEGGSIRKAGGIPAMIQIAKLPTKKQRRRTRGM